MKISTLNLKVLAALALVGSVSQLALAQDYDDSCKKPKTSYKNVNCTGKAGLFVAYKGDMDYAPIALLDAQGKKVADLKGFENIDTWNVNHDLIAVQKNGKVGYINTQGKLVIPAIYDDLQDPDDKYDETWANAASKEGTIVVAKNGKYGVIDTKGKTVVPLKYEELNDFSEGMASFRKGEKWGFIDKTGKEVIPAQYYLNGNFGGYYGFSEGVANVGKNNKWGAIDKTGKVVVPIVYDNIQPMSQGLMGVQKGEYWGFVDRNNKTVIPFKYPESKVNRFSVNYNGASYFIFEDDGHALVTTDAKGESMCINKSQQVVTCRDGLN